MTTDTQETVNINCYQAIKDTTNYTFNIIKFIYKATSIYIIWIILHYVASHLYVKFCVPATPFGFFYSAFIISTPHCRAMRWVISNGAASIDNMWLIFGTWLCSRILMPRVA